MRSAWRHRYPPRCGEKPEILADLETVLDYCESQITALLAVTHTGQEGDPLDFESKVLHAGMIDQVGMEVADLAQISALGTRKPTRMPRLPRLDGHGRYHKTGHSRYRP